MQSKRRGVPQQGRRRFGVAVLGGLMMSPAAVLGEQPQAPSIIQSTQSNVEGSAERMISYRNQNHMWVSSDGGVHLLANLGSPDGSPALVLHSSFDNGLTWSPGPVLPDTDHTSTSDGFLVNDNLFVTCSTAGGGVSVTSLSYSAQDKTWTVGTTEIAFQVDGVLAINPAMARDGSGRYWLAFTARDSQGAASIRMVRRVSAAEGWVDTGFTFGSVGDGTVERSGRPVAVPGGVGLVYTVQQDVYWARRSNDWSLSQAWARTLVYKNRAADNDPYGSHFSAAVDATGNVHVATTEGGQLLYLRLDQPTQTWSRKVLTKPINVAYMKVVKAASGTLSIVYNDKSKLGVYQSVDGGANWSRTHLLTHPQAGNGQDYGNPRVEAPGTLVGSPFAVVQQYTDGGVNKLLWFQVPVQVP